MPTTTVPRIGANLDEDSARARRSDPEAAVNVDTGWFDRACEHFLNMSTSNAVLYILGGGIIGGILLLAAQAVTR